MSKNKFVRSVSFNYKNEKDVARLNLIGRKKFSTYIKKLLDEELKREEEQKAMLTKQDKSVVSVAPENESKIASSTKEVIPDQSLSKQQKSSNKSNSSNTQSKPFLLNENRTSKNN